MNNTNENNKLIAEFMGLELEETLNGLSVYARKEQNPIKLNDIKTEFYDLNELKYHISWDWLMLVVSKCFKTGDDPHQWDNIMDTIFTCNISIVYAQTVQFIKNQNS